MARIAMIEIPAALIQLLKIQVLAMPIAAIAALEI
jgi:hypothetical protein